MALGIDGLRIGCWTSPSGPSGCTVVLPPPHTLGAIAVRGSAPGTREAVALGPTGKVSVCHAVVLSGGSAFGLSTADGVVNWLEEHGIGYPTRAAVVPIVGAAIVLDQGVANRDARPDSAAGRNACEAASDEDPPEGGVGAGTGCTVAKVGGLDHAWRGGQGIAMRRVGGVTVGAIVVNNAFGEILDEDGRWIARSRAPRDVPRFPEALDAQAATQAANLPGGSGPRKGRGYLEGAEEGGPAGHTVIGCIATDARLSKQEGVRVADLAHSGVTRTVRPAHTSLDGDAMFCLATGQVNTHLDLVTALAADVVAEACQRAVLAATTRDGVTGLATGGRTGGLRGSSGQRGRCAPNGRISMFASTRRKDASSVFETVSAVAGRPGRLRRREGRPADPASRSNRPRSPSVSGATPCGSLPVSECSGRLTATRVPFSWVVSPVCTRTCTDPRRPAITSRFPVALPTWWYQSAVGQGLRSAVPSESARARRTGQRGLTTRPS